ncbi:hypothetical protein C0992_010977 [Termitomyces sp. T32_za158]|nr:hypothetical protein C0992_010977 [Termitomyces sp. T32_za158]
MVQLGAISAKYILQVTLAVTEDDFEDEEAAGWEAEIEEWEETVWCERGQNSGSSGTCSQSRYVHHSIGKLYEKRYQKSHKGLSRGAGNLPHLLHILKHKQPDHFHGDLRVSPFTFDRLVNCIINDSIFSNNSQNKQMPVEEQLAITLYHFGHYSNATGLDKVAKWSGYAKGTILLATRHVMMALLWQDFIAETI